MISSRPLLGTDIPMVQAALDADTEFHPGQTADLYAGPDMYSVVYEDEQGPIGVLRYTKVLRLCTVWCNNKDRLRNGASIMQAIGDSVEMAKKNGYTEIVFETNSPLLERFCTTKLGFEKVTGNTLSLYVRKDS